MRFRRPAPDAVPRPARLRLDTSRRWIRRATRAAGAGFAAATIALATTATTAAGANAPPVLNAPGNQVYEQGETIIPVSIGISDPDHDTTVVTVTNLPPGLSFRTGQVQGTVAAGAAAQDYLVTIKADDRVNAPVTAAFTITVTAREQTPPTVTISGPTQPQRGAFRVRIAFSEAVTGFEQADVTVGNGFARKFTGSGANYTAEIRITPGFSGTVTVDVAANVAEDADGDGNRAASRYSVEGDQTRPTVTLSGPTAPQQGAFNVAIAFSEPVTGFERSDVAVGNGSVTAFTGSGAAYTATITGAATGTVMVDVAAHVATDATGNPNMPARRYSVQAQWNQLNAPPVITRPNDQTYEQGEAISPFGITVTDADGDPVTITVTGLPSGLSYASDQLQGTVAADAAAQAYTVTISAQDGVNAAVTQTFTISVTETAPANSPANAPPVIAVPGSKTYVRGEAITAFGIAVTDAEGDALTVTLTGLPSGLSYANGQVQGTVAADATIRAYTVTIQAEDGVNAAVTGTFTISVTETAPANSPANAPPVIAAPGQKTYARGEAITAFGIAVTDAEGDALTVTVTGLPSGLSYANGQVQGTVAASAVVGDHGATIQADDGVNEAVTATFTITVTEAAPANSPANAPPVITDPGQKTYERGEAITAFSIAVTDAAGDAVTVTLTGLPSGLSYANGQVQGTVAASAVVGDHTATIQADDGVNGAVTETFTVSVTASGAANSPGNAPPVITDPGRKTYGRGEAITAFSIAVTDAEGDAVTVTVTGLPSGLSYANGQVQGTVADDAVAGDHTVTIQADDGGDAPAIETFTITVTPTAAAGESNSPPVITGPGNKTYERGEAITAFGITVSDADGDTVTVTVTGLPSGLTYTNGQVQGTVADGAAAGDHTVTILADDGGDEGAAETFTITVRARRAKRTSTSFSDYWDMKSDSLVPGNAFHVEEGDTLVVTFTWKGQGAQFAAWSTHGGLSGGPTYDVATSGTDYEAVIPARLVAVLGNGGSITIRHRIWEDGLVERNEVFQLGFRFAAGGVSIAAAFPVTILNDDRATIAVSDATRSEGGDLEFTATLNTFLKGGIKVTPTFTDVTAVAGTDYARNTTPITFAGRANEKKTFTVSTTQDVVAEQDETFRAGLDVDWTSTNFQSQNSYTGNGDVIAITAGTGTIEDDEPKLTVDDAYAREGDPITFTVTLDNAVSGGLTVTPSFTDVTATKGTDYTENTAALTFAGTAGETKSFTVATTEDTDAEGTETFTVSLAVSGTQSLVAATDTAGGSIVDGEAVLPAVTIEDVSAEEGDSMTFTVTLDKAVSGGLTVTPSFGNGMTPGFAVKGTDYTENTAPLSFTGTAGETKTFTVATIEDADVEVHEIFHVNLRVSGTHVPVRATDFAAGTILDDDSAALTIDDASAVEGASMTFTVTLNKEVTGGVTAGVNVTDGTATWSKDYHRGADKVIFTGTAGETQTFTVSTMDDNESEAAETFTVSLNVPDGTLVRATDTATGTILDNDRPVLTIDDASAAEGDSMTFTVTLDKAVSGGLTVTPGFTDMTATKGTDYTENTVALNFTGTANETQTITVMTTEDGTTEPDETFTVGLSVSGTQVPVTATDTATGTIMDDDGALPAVTVADVSAAEGDSMTFTVTLDKAVSGGLTVTPSFTDSSATEGTDYTENTTALTFAGTAGETQTLTVATTQDSDAEVEETFYLDLTVSGTQRTVKATDWALGTINDDDSSRLTVADASASEGNSMTFTVTLDKAVSGGLTVTPAFTDVTATEGTDYTENTDALTFTGTAGEEQTFSVATHKDEDSEDDETFTVSLTVSGTSATVASDTATGTVTRDDQMGHSPAVVTVADASADEGDSMTFTVTLDKAVAGGLTVTPSFTDDTAAEGTDYTENTAALTFAGATGETQTFTVATTEDTDTEADETFTVGLAVSGTTTTVTATDTATGTILDDDAPAVTIADASASEGDSMTFAVSLNQPVTGGLTVTPSFTDVTATEGTDYTENTAALIFTGARGETQTFTVATTEDTDTEADETFTVGLAVSGTTTTVTATDSATGTISDDDAARGTLTIGDASAFEGDEIAFAVTLDRPIPGGFTVTPELSDATARSGEDYRADTPAVQFTGNAGETRTLRVPTLEDTVKEEDETFTVRLLPSHPQAVATQTATGTILDDDELRGTLTIGDARALEGDELTFAITLDRRIPGGLTVTPQLSDGTATSGTDYRAESSPVRFAGDPGETHSFTVPSIEDSEEEGDETFTVALAIARTSAAVTAATATGTIVDDDLSPIHLRAAPARVAEAGGATSVRVTASRATVRTATTVSVTVGAADDPAVAGTDYRASPTSFTVTIPAGSREGSAVVRIEPVDDSLIEPDEPLTVTGVAGSRQVTPATVTLVDDDASSAHLVVTMEPNVVPENAGPTLVTVVAEVVGATAGMALPVTMVVGGSDDTAEAAVDYEAVEAFGVTIPVGSSEGSATFLLSPIEDELLEGSELLTVTGSTLRLERASDQGTIRDEQLGEARAEGTGRTLFLLARAIGSESLAAIEERFAGRRAGRETRSGTAPVLDQSTGGRPDWSARMRMRGGPSPGADPYGLNDSAAGLERPEPHPFGGLGWIDGSTFVAPLGGGEAQAGGAGGEAGAAEDRDDAGWVLWGRAASTRTAVQATPVTQARGDLFTMHLGADTRLGKEMLLGLALSHSRGKLGYTLGETPDSAPAAVEGGLASVQPYAHWTPRSGLEVWGLGGLGRGSLQVSDGFGQADTGVGMRMAAGGVRQEVGVESGLAVKADVFHVALQSEAQPDLPAARATAVRARMLVEWQAEWAATAFTLLRPRLEVGGRWDGGTDVGGIGSEVGGGVSVVNIRQKLELAVSGRYLVAHQEEGFDEWGASVTLRGGPGVEGRGPWVSLEPEWGAAASQVQSLVGPQPDPAFQNAAAAGRIAGVQPDRSRLAAGYSLPEMGADFRLEGVRETLGLEADPKYGVRLSASFSW